MRKNWLTGLSISLKISPMQIGKILLVSLVGWELFTIHNVFGQTVGTVTALQGQAQLTRAGARSGLKFRDDLILRDAIDTREQSLARILFGGKSTVTIRELSHLDVREELLPGAGTRTVHQLSTGEVLLRLVRQLLNTGDEVQIQTPNAVAAVRGTTLYAQFVPELAQTTFTVINGNATVTPLGLAAINLPGGSSVVITGTQATGVRVSPTRVISQVEAMKILEDSEIVPAFTQEAARDETVRGLGEGAVKEPLQTGTAECWPDALCETRASAAGGLINVPLPVGSSTNIGSKGSTGVRSFVALVSGSGKP